MDVEARLTQVDQAVRREVRGLREARAQRREQAEQDDTSDTFLSSAQTRAAEAQQSLDEAAQSNDPAALHRAQARLAEAHEALAELQRHRAALRQQAAERQQANEDFERRVSELLGLGRALRIFADQTQMTTPEQLRQALSRLAAGGSDPAASVVISLGEEDEWWRSAD